MYDWAKRADMKFSGEPGTVGAVSQMDCTDLFPLLQQLSAQIGDENNGLLLILPWSYFNTKAASLVL